MRGLLRPDLYEVYCCRTSNLTPGDLAISSVFYPASGFTAAIVFGCTGDLKDQIIGRLKMTQSENWSSHPLLIIGILVELERTRHREQVKERTGLMMQRVLDLHNDDVNLTTTTARLKKDNYSVMVWIKIIQLRDSMQSWKAQLQRMIEHADQLEREILVSGNNSTKDDWRQHAAHTGSQIKKRILEIFNDYDHDIRQCTAVISGLTLATQMVWSPAFRLPSQKLTRSTVVEPNHLPRRTNESENCE